MDAHFCWGHEGEAGTCHRPPTTTAAQKPQWGSSHQAADRTDRGSLENFHLVGSAWWQRFPVMIHLGGIYAFYESKHCDFAARWALFFFFPSPASGFVLHLPAGSPAATESRYLPTCAALGTGSRSLLLPCCSTRCALLNPKWFNQSGVCPTHPGSDTFITRCQSFSCVVWWWASRLVFRGRCKSLEKAFQW